MVLYKLGFQKNDTVLTGDIPSLTSMRFVASVYVILFHVLIFSETDAHGIWNNFFASGYMAVDFFFILSGFILAHSYIKSIESGDFTFKNFIIKRFARIYPIHIVCLLSMYLLIYISSLFSIIEYPEHDNLMNFLQNIFLVHSWFGYGEYSFNKPSWSISSEFFAYLMFPTFMFLGLSVTKVRFTAFSFVLFFVTYVFLVVNFDKKITELTVNYGLLRIVPEFLMGIGVYSFFCQYSFVHNVKRSLCICCFIILVCFFLYDVDFLAIPLMGFILFFLSELRRKKISFWLDRPVFVYLGQVSYSLYMVHYFVWMIFMLFFHEEFLAFVSMHDYLEFFKFYILAFLILFFALPLAMITHRYIEDPCRKWVIKKF